MFYSNKSNSILMLITTVFGLVVCCATTLFGQETFSNYPFDTTRIYIVELQDGSLLIGSFLRKDSIAVVIKTSSAPDMKISIQGIESVLEVGPSNLKTRAYWFPNPYGTRYLLSPSAFMLRRGEGYYQNTNFFLNSFQIGITNHISIGGGIEFPTTLNTSDLTFFVSPKVSFKVADKLHVGANVLYASIPDLDEHGNSGSFGTYGIATYGSTDHNLTAGLGWGRGFVEEKPQSGPMISVSGMARIAPKVALVSENWFIPGGKYFALISYGIRFFGEKFALDLAFFDNKEISEEIIIGIPYVDFVVKF